MAPGLGPLSLVTSLLGARSSIHSGAGSTWFFSLPPLFFFFDHLCCSLPLAIGRSRLKSACLFTFPAFFLRLLGRFPRLVVCLPRLFMLLLRMLSLVPLRASCFAAFFRFYSLPSSTPSRNLLWPLFHVMGAPFLCASLLGSFSFFPSVPVLASFGFVVCSLAS